MPPRRSTARPVCGAPVDALRTRGPELAKGWLLALLEDAPLEHAAGLAVAFAAGDGPRVCAAVVRALADDGALAGLGVVCAEVGPTAGASDVPGVLAAVDALQAVVWSWLRAELRGADGDYVAALAERLTGVFARVRGAAVRGFLDRGLEAVDVLIGEARRADEPLALLLVELDEAERLSAVDGVAAVEAALGRLHAAARAVLGARDVFVREGGGDRQGRAWVIAPGRDRVGAAALAERIAAAVAGVGGEGGEGGEGWRGAPLPVSVGTAVLGEDGDDRATLVSAAEASRFAAVADGVTVVDPNWGHSGPPLGPQ